MNPQHGVAVMLASGGAGVLGEVLGIVAALVTAAGLIGAAVITQVMSDKRRTKKYRRYDADAVEELGDPVVLMAKLLQAHEELDKAHDQIRELRRNGKS